MTGIDEVKETDEVRVYIQRIERETSDLTYIWDSIGAWKTEIADNGNSVEHI